MKKRLRNKSQTVMEKLKVKGSKLYAYSVVAIIIAMTLIAFPKTIEKIAAEGVTEESAQATVLKSDPFDTLELQAKSVYVYDMPTGQVLFEKNASQALPLASLTKIMTAVTAFDIAPTSTVVTVSRDQLALSGDSGILAGEKWLLPDLMRFTLVVSSNDGAQAIAANLGSRLSATSSDESIRNFVEAMNIETKKLGLSATVFLNPTGLDVSREEAGAYGSAKDVARLFSYAVTHFTDLFTPTSKPYITEISLDNISHTGTNTDILADKIPGLIAGKTGYTDLAGGNLALLFEPNPKHKVVIVVLGSTYDGRFSDMDKLVQATKTQIGN